MWPGKITITALQRRAANLNLRRSREAEARLTVAGARLSRDIMRRDAVFRGWGTDQTPFWLARGVVSARRASNEKTTGHDRGCKHAVRLPGSCRTAGNRF